jgi:hypothetical protein
MKRVLRINYIDIIAMDCVVAAKEIELLPLWSEGYIVGLRRRRRPRRHHVNACDFSQESHYVVPVIWSRRFYKIRMMREGSRFGCR